MRPTITRADFADPRLAGRGIASRLLVHLLGFPPCPPFGSYVDDPHSTFMTLALARR